MKPTLSNDNYGGIQNISSKSGNHDFLLINNKITVLLRS